MQTLTLLAFIAALRARNTSFAAAKQLKDMHNSCKNHYRVHRQPRLKTPLAT